MLLHRVDTSNSESSSSWHENQRSYRNSQRSEPDSDDNSNDSYQTYISIRSRRRQQNQTIRTTRENRSRSSSPTIVSEVGSLNSWQRENGHTRDANRDQGRRDVQEERSLRIRIRSSRNVRRDGNRGDEGHIRRRLQRVDESSHRRANDNQYDPYFVIGRRLQR